MNLLTKYDLPRKNYPRVGVYPVKGGKIAGPPTRLIWTSNDVLFGGADVMARLVAGDAEFKLRVMYFEFENLSNPADPITAPVFDRSGGLSYYQNLLDPKDYLRVPITVSASLLSSDDTKFQGNQATFFALTGGNKGVNGRTFAAASNSTVYGVALAAAPVLDDPTRDIVFARDYFTDQGGGENKFLKEIGAEIGLTWPIRFQ